jgi:hypothetical protein
VSSRAIPKFHEASDNDEDMEYEPDLDDDERDASAIEKCI